MQHASACAGEGRSVPVIGADGHMGGAHGVPSESMLLLQRGPRIHLPTWPWAVTSLAVNIQSTAHIANLMQHTYLYDKAVAPQHAIHSFKE